MRVPIALLMPLLVVLSCRGYDFDDRLVNQDGLVPPDQFARYGREQAQAIAIGREFGHAHHGSSAQDLTRQADAATSYARTLPDVVNVKADPQGLLLTVQFRSGWRTMITPISDGKRGSETVGLPAKSSAAGSR